MNKALQKIGRDFFKIDMFKVGFALFFTVAFIILTFLEAPCGIDMLVTAEYHCGPILELPLKFTFFYTILIFGLSSLVMPIRNDILSITLGFTIHFAISYFMACIIKMLINLRKTS